MKTKEGLWKLSPSGLYTFKECTSCFWIDNHFKKAPMLPLLLNSAMDSILKARYDTYRADNTFPPEVRILEKEGITPFLKTETLNIWRESLRELRVVNSIDGYVLQGKIDDVLVEADGRLIPADYKSSGNAPAEDKQKYYRDQLAAYGFMFQKHGYEVSDRAYLLHYFVKDKNNPSISVSFDSHVDLVKINMKEIEKKLKDMVNVLEAGFPGENPSCQKCCYYAGRIATIDEDMHARDINELYEKAKIIASKNGSMSTSVIQKEFRIGYARAVRILDMLIDNKIIQNNNEKLAKKTIQ